MIAPAPKNQSVFHRFRSQSNNPTIALPEKTQLPNPGSNVAIHIAVEHCQRWPGLVEILLTDGMPALTVICLPSEVAAWHAWLCTAARTMPGGVELFGDEAEIVTVAAAFVRDAMAAGGAK